MTEQQAREVMLRYQAEYERVRRIWQGNKTAHQAAYDRALDLFLKAQTNYMRVSGPGGMTTDEFNAQQTGQTTGSEEQRDALARIREVISGWWPDPNDVQTLTDFAWGLILKGVTSAADLAQQLRETEPYKREYGTVIEGQRAAGITVSSPAEIRAYREQAAALMRQAGLPTGFYDQKEDIDRFLVGNVSIGELGARINDGYVRYMQQPAEDRAEFERIYGAGAGAAYFMDPNRALPIIERQLAASEVAGASKRSGFGELTIDEAQDAAALGISGSEAEARLGMLVGSRELFTGLPGQENAEDTIGREEQLGAVLRGNANAQLRIERRRQRRLAAFAGGGGPATTAEGVVGLR